MTLYVEWEGLARLDEDGDDVSPLVRVYFTASGWVAYERATWMQPAEGGFYEDVHFIRAEIDPCCLPCDPLTEAELDKIADWFATPEAREQAYRVANDDAERFA